ncbi:hypothetical protein RB594_000527 [Gaeumannomyces avenae]
MPSIFSRLKGKDGPTKLKNKKGGGLDHLKDQAPAKPRWEDAFTRPTVEPEEIEELVRRCTAELKARGLDLPFLLLPFRPTSDPSGVRIFIRHFFDPSSNLRGEMLTQELRMIEPMVISGVIKWCWARLQGGLVGWDAYELFKVGEQDSGMARDSFKTFIPLSIDNDARTSIVFDFFDLLSAVAAHGKANGFGGRKLSRMASWWAFEHKDTGSGFDGSYKAWLKAADATSHLFFAYLRTLSPQRVRAGISALPTSLQKLVQETEYPPERPSLMMSSTYKVVMFVETVSPTPFALLRRGNHFQYREDDRMLREFSEYDDPIQALTEECRRVLKSVSAANQTQAVSSSKHSTGLRDASWSRFEDIGFTATLAEEDEDDDSAGHRRQAPGLRSAPASGAGLARPTTPSWADFLSAGFVDDGPNSPSNLLLPPDKVLPPIDTTVRQRSAQSHRPRLETERHLEPGELASISRFELDDSFWWVWMTSLAPEETSERKSSFGRCAVIETSLRSGRWLVMEEMVKGAVSEPDAGAYIAEKKGFFSWTRRNKGGLSRSKSTGKHALNKGDHGAAGIGISKASIGPDQQAKIQAAAQQLQARQLQERQTANLGSPTRRGRTDHELMAEKTNSVMTMQPMIMSEASPAMKWANKYDKDAIKEAYLANNNTGRGMSQANLHANGHAEHDEDERPPPPTKSPSLMPQSPSSAVPPSPMLRNQDDMSTHGRGSPLPPPKERQPSIELARHTTMSPEPNLSPDSKKHQKKLHKEKDKAASGGLRKLFGRKNRQSKLPDHAAADLNGMLAQDGQKNSVEVPAPQEWAAPKSPEPPISWTGAAMSPAEQRDEDRTPRAHTPSTPTRPPVAQSTPVRQEPEPHHEASVDNTSPVDTHDAAEAREEFSRFDQGPLDAPAFIPESDEEDDVTPPPIARETSRVAEKPVRAPVNVPISPVSPVSPVPPALDRWAQIRKNAADRAAQRQSEEQSQGGFSKTTDGDGDTSGEETIESRVARIKARVAELTGNMENTPGAPPRAPQPLRR